MIGPKFFAEALAEYEDAVVFYETREQGLGARLVIFAVRQETLIVVAVFHGWRSPGYRMERVKHLPRRQGEPQPT